MKKIFMIVAFALLSFQANAASMNWDLAQSTAGVIVDEGGPSDFISAHYGYTPDTPVSSVTFAVELLDTMSVESIVTDSQIQDMFNVISVSWDGGGTYDFTAARFQEIWNNGPIVAAANTYIITAQLNTPITSRGQINVQIIGTDVSEVPVPAAVWLFGSALMGIVGFSRRKSYSVDA